MAIPQVGAVGLTIKVTMLDQDRAPINLAATTARQIYLRRPDGRVTACAATIVSAAAGVMSYVTVLGDLDVPGDWRIQGRLTTSPTTDYFSDVQPFRVAENIAP